MKITDNFYYIIILYISALHVHICQSSSRLFIESFQIYTLDGILIIGSIKLRKTYICVYLEREKAKNYQKPIILYLNLKRSLRQTCADDLPVAKTHLLIGLNKRFT